MARRADIKGAFLDSIKRDSSGRIYVTTAKFVQELAKVNHDFTGRQANEWIRYYQNHFMDVTNDDYNESKTCVLRNMGYVL